MNWGELSRQVMQLNQQRRFAAAEALVRPWVRNGQAPLPVWRLLVAAVKAQGRVEETRQIQEMLVDVEPGNLTTRFELAETLLLQGEFTRGWREYRHRYSMPHTKRIERKVQKPRWDGQDLRGKTLLIHDEQGYGDTFQFLRMVPWARQRSGARTILQINAEQIAFGHRMEGVDEVITREALPPPFDVHCEMMSLPMAMNLQMTDLPGEIPYLKADPVRVEAWRQRLVSLPRPLVALCWAGRPTHVNDAARSMSLKDLAPLAGIDVTFLAIQKGDRAIEVRTPPAGMNIVSVNNECRDFDDTAAILALADLLVSVDSAPVHLAGAMGRPVWVMLPFVHDWRWLETRNDSPWYPSMRLFRQDTPQSWGAVIASIGAGLRAITRHGG